MNWVVASNIFGDLSVTNTASMGFILPCDVMGLTDQTYVRHLFYRMLSGDQRVVNCFGL